MTVYVVAQLTMNDRTAYERYQARFMAVFERFNGKLLASDENPAVVEGQGKVDKVVLISFPDAVSFRQWSESSDYQEISIDRKAGAEALVLLVQGISTD